MVLGAAEAFKGSADACIGRLEMGAMPIVGLARCAFEECRQQSL
jgi:hypothetical protein